MRFIRTIVVVLVLLAATPAMAQDPNPPRRIEAPQVRTLVVGYTGIYGRFIYGRTGFGLPAARPRVAWIVDDFIEEGRPLGFSTNAYGTSPFARTSSAWTGWPYYAHGRDEAPKGAPRAESEAALRDGRARWKGGDYAGALGCFKKAVAEDLSNGAARLHMALALLEAGDLRNADKAVTSAVGIVRHADELAAIEFSKLFRNEKERGKFEDKLIVGRDGSGSLVVALAQHLLGLKAKAATTLEGSKDPAAARLAELLR
ncbi:MAG TPA: hypothetical protein VFS19_02280 [Planctomycetota bacterium]|nr:hypothetical protein [Planctomycetota bacterium]